MTALVNGGQQWSTVVSTGQRWSAVVNGPSATGATGKLPP